MLLYSGLKQSMIINVIMTTIIPQRLFLNVNKQRLKNTVIVKCYPKYKINYTYQGSHFSNDVHRIGQINGSNIFIESMTNNKSEVENVIPTFFETISEKLDNFEHENPEEKVEPDESKSQPMIINPNSGPPHRVTDIVIEELMDDAIKASKNLQALFIKAILAGVFIGLGGVLCSSVGGDVPSLMNNNPGLQRAIFGALGFPVSIFLVTTIGASAMTGTIVMCAAAAYEKKMRIKDAIHVLSVAWVGNAIGLLLVAILAASGSMDAVGPCMEIALHKSVVSFGEVFARGIGGGILICCAICQAYAAKDGVSKILGIWFCISTYVMCGWEHGLANLFFFPCALFGNPGGPMTWGTFITTNLVPSTLGNIVGGCLLGAILTIIHTPSK